MGLNALLDQQDACTKIRTKITAEFPARNKIVPNFLHLHNSTDFSE
jgi:hypothetical protein